MLPFCPVLVAVMSLVVAQAAAKTERQMRRWYSLHQEKGNWTRSTKRYYFILLKTFFSLRNLVAEMKELLWKLYGDSFVDPDYVS